MIYDFTVLSLLPNTLGPVLSALPATYESHAPGGDVLGCFACEFGALNRFALLSVYTDVAALQTDRARVMEAEDPFGIGQYLGGVEQTAFRPLDFANPITKGGREIV